ncbi:hypothetical protein [Devosia sp. UYZn731]|uniref:hypothetical protein n=1 Tax=Devosia sp. UYZn731 TaxID=3156345 RepID=UPI00339A1314
MRSFLLSLLVPLIILSSATFARESFGKPVSEQEFAHGFQGCWDEKIPADEIQMVSRHYCFSGGLQGELSAEYTSQNEGWGDTLKYELKDGHLILSPEIGDHPSNPSYSTCDAVVFARQSLKLDCNGYYKGEIYLTFSSYQNGPPQ